MIAVSLISVSSHLIYCTTFLNSSRAVIPGLTGRGVVSRSALSVTSGNDVLHSHDITIVKYDSSRDLGALIFSKVQKRKSGWNGNMSLVSSVTCKDAAAAILCTSAVKQATLNTDH